MTLNNAGCRRTVSEWQNWVQKVKQKYRNLRDQTRSTGGGPNTLRPLTEVESKVLEIVGVAAVVGFTNEETPLVASGNRPEHLPNNEEVLPLTAQEQDSPLPSSLNSPLPSTSREALQPSTSREAAPSVGPSPSLQTPTRWRRPQPQPYPPRRRDQRRTRSSRRERAETLSNTLDRNNELFRASIAQAADTVAASISGAGAVFARSMETLAAAISGAGAAIATAVENSRPQNEGVVEYLEDF